jgi:MoaA/NifB/PqqE/SkfB family radical SAM enzyme
MDFAKKISSMLAVIRANLTGRGRVLSCQFAITNRCPWRCLYCNVENTTAEECSTGEVCRIIDELADAGVIRLHLVGGEPMLRNDLGEIIGHAKQRGLYVTMATSGIRIPQLFDQVKETDLFLMSFDGPQEVHDYQRNQGSYRVLREAMQCLRANGKEFWTTTVVTRANMGRIDFILDTAAAEGFICNFHLLYSGPDTGPLPGYLHPPETTAALAASDEEYRRLLRYLWQRKRTDLKKIIGDSSSYLRVLIDWGDLSRVYRREEHRQYTCWAGRLFAYIDSNGDLYPCCDVIGRVPGRNLLKLGFARARESLPELPCRSCIVACYTEMNLMFSLNLSSICNWVFKV